MKRSFSTMNSSAHQSSQPPQYRPIAVALPRSQASPSPGFAPASPHQAWATSTQSNSQSTQLQSYQPELPLQQKTRTLLQCVPVCTAEQCSQALVDSDSKEEKALLRLVDFTAKTLSRSEQERNLTANKVLDSEVKSDTLRVHRQSLTRSIQECFVALKIARNVDDAVKDLKMQEDSQTQNKERNGGAELSR